LTSEAPSHLSDHAKDVWRTTIENLQSENRPLHQLNEEILIGFASSASIARECGEILAREGYLISGGRDGSRRHPAASIRMSALQSLRAFAAELGLSPASSGRLPKPSIAMKPNKFSQFQK
jgi:P27 family predicted phage terminase small subunit